VSRRDAPAPRRRIGGVRVAVSAEAREGLARAAEAHLDDVYGYLLYLTGDRTVADDLTAETFERAFRSWKRFDPRRGTAKTWLCQIARSGALDHFRSEERRRRREGTYALREQAAVDESEVFGHGLSPELEEALRSLSAAEREVIALRVLLDLDGESAARLLGISPTACSTRLHRALGKLEEYVRGNADVVA
jgi:RNA polymerase sigma-70 factor, ECF subfamily